MAIFSQKSQKLPYGLGPRPHTFMISDSQGIQFAQHDAHSVTFF